MTRYIGIDPGPTPGFFVIWTTERRVTTTDIVQSNHELAPAVLKMLMPSPSPVYVQTERFVIGRKSMRSGRAGTVTVDLVGNLERIVADAKDAPHRVWAVRNASQVKAWATDERLERAGLLDLCKGMRHARDAARHALFAAVHDGGLPDPMSKEWNR